VKQGFVHFVVLCSAGSRMVFQAGTCAGRPRPAL
jgi:hypothetical protein